MNQPSGRAGTGEQQADSGLLVVDKPAGWTSHQVVARVRRIYGTRKVGHAGTLDPMATGVLVIGLNRATRLLGHLALHDKAYTATIRLGQSTTTDDAEGEVVETRDASSLTDAEVDAAVAALRGDLEQVPSSVSAIKVDGKRAYARVRAGETVSLKARAVNVARFEVLGRSAHDGVLDLDVAVECSTGTYVRALARDLGDSLGVGGHLTALRRTRVGPYLLPSDPLDLSADQPVELMSMGAAAKLSFECVEVDAAVAAKVTQGQPVAVRLSSLAGLVDSTGSLLALYSPAAEDAATARAVAVFASATS